MRQSRSVRVVLSVLGLLCGCSVSPPPAPHEDAALAELAFAPHERPAQRLALSVSASATGRAAPRWESARDVAGDAAGVDSGDAAAVDTAGVARPVAAPLTLPAREYASDAHQVPLFALLSDLQQSLQVGGLETIPLAQGSADEPTPSPRSQEGQVERLLAAADQQDAPLLLHLDLRQVRAAWVERDGFLWWFDAFMFWVPGVYPIWFVPDEVYEVAALARAQVVHVASGRVLLERDLIGRAAQALNNPQRGWSPGGMLFLHPYTLDEDDFQDVFEGLWPHAQRALEREVLGWLRAELPAALGESEQLLAREGGRTLALVVGAPGPAVQGGLDRPPPLRGAVADAQAVARLLRDSGQLARGGQPLALLAGEGARRESVLEAARELAGRARPGDQLLIYYAGYGLFDSRGQAALLLNGEELPLAELAAALPSEVRVTWLLDTSFAGAGGRTWPGAPVADPAAGLLPIRRKGWDGILAAAPGQAALESGDRPGGVFTTWLLTGARGAADEDGDGQVSLGEMTGYLSRWLTPEVRERQGALQAPVRLSGGEAGARLVRVPPALADSGESDDGSR